MKKIRAGKIKKIISLIKNNNDFLITAHMNLEGDALGSELALYSMLKKLKKNAVIWNQDPTPKTYDFLPKHQVIKKVIKKRKFDVIFALDCSDISRSGKVKEDLPEFSTLVNIDHHISNTYFGDLNWVEPKIGSTCEMIYYLADKLKLVDNEVALCLYTGIVTDTGNFTYASTSSQTHKVIADLMNFNIQPDWIDQKINSLCEADDLKLIGRHISRLKFTSNKKVCWATISKWQDKNYDFTEVIFSIMRLLRDPEVLIIFKKIGKNKTRINFRSRSNLDVNKIAKFFKGGGHQKASGTTLEENLKDSENKVISFVRKQINEKKSS